MKRRLNVLRQNMDFRDRKIPLCRSMVNKLLIVEKINLTLQTITETTTCKFIKKAPSTTNFMRKTKQFKPLTKFISAIFFVFAALIAHGGGCISVNVTSISVAPSTTVCSGTSITLTANGATLCGGQNINWYSGNACGGGILSTANPYTFAAPTVPGTYFYSARNSGLVACGASVSITVLGQTLSGASQSAAVCGGTSATINLTGLIPGSTSTVSYSINGTPQTPVSGVVASAGGNGSFSTAVLTNSNNGQTLTITSITNNSTTPNCTTNFTQNVTLSVLPGPTLTLTSAAGTNNQARCLGSAITNITYSAGGSATGTTVTWVPAGTPAGLTITTGATTTISGTPTVAGTYNYTVTTTGGTCGSTGATGTITVSTPPSAASIAQSSPINLTCPTTTTALTGNTPAVGTGTWSVTSGSGTVSPTNSPSTTATAGTGATVYTWTISNPGCPSSSASITVNLPVCNDDPCGAYPLTVVNSTNCAPTVNLTNVGSTFSTGMPEPACGYVNGTTSGDVWYSAVVPADGQLQITAVGDVNFDPMVSVYDGACASLQAAGCVASNGYASNAFPLTYAGTPGSTVYIRVNESLGGDATTGSFGLCAYTTNTGTVSQVLPGVTTTVSCGSTLNFYDTGGQGGTATTSTLQPPPAGNYTNNTGTTYRICPSDPTQYVQIQFNQFYVENGFDKMVITSGNNNVIAQWTSNQGAGDIVTSQAPGECLTIYFQSDYSYTGLGWEAVVSCTNTMQPSQINNESAVQNCTGNGGVWVCADGTYNTAAGSGAGIDEINEVTGGCWGAAGEVATSWFYFTTASAGSLAFQFVPSNSGHNINFALYGPSTNGVPPCPLITGDAPIRCSFADIGGANTGLQAGQTDSYDGNAGYGGNGFAEPVTVVAGQTYALAVDVYQNGQPPTQTTIDFTGVAALSCNFPLPITLSDFSGINQGNENLLSWIVQSQYNNDYFTVERSLNGINWQVVGRVEGEGTSDRPMFYDLRDPSPYFPLTYYRLKQTDFDGEYNYSHIISISSLKDLDGEFIGHLSPNPASGYATFNYNGTDVTTPLNVQIVNEMGKVISNLTFMNIFKGMPQTIGTSELANGTYHIIFTQGDNRQVQKLVILR